MDRTAETRWDDKRTGTGADDFAALFAQLDVPDASASIDGGLSRLFYAMQAFKRERPNVR